MNKSGNFFNAVSISLGLQSLPAPLPSLTSDCSLTRPLRFAFIFLFHFLTSFLLSVHPSRPVFIHSLRFLHTGDSAKQMVRQKTDLQCVQRAHNEAMRAGKEEQGKCKKDERERERLKKRRKKQAKDRRSSITSMVILLSLAAGSNDGNRSFLISPFNVF